MKEKQSNHQSKKQDLLIVFLVYLLALGVFVLVNNVFAGEMHVLLQVLLADIAATAVVFIFSMIFDNSSIYDPYWSIFPLFIFIYFITAAGNGGVSRLFAAAPLLLFAAVGVWGCRLTRNWVLGWNGMNQEDWRYRDFRKNSGTWYWAVSFLGIHLFPTLIVFAAATPVYAGLSENISGITLLRVVGVVICLFGTALELIADRQMREFREEHDRKGAVCTSGLWAYSRHPNYLGELLFWWGIFVFSLPGAWPWHAAGPVLMTMLFVFISIPMMERHLLSRKPEYAEIKDEVPMLIPLKVGAERSTADRGM